MVLDFSRKALDQRKEIKRSQKSDDFAGAMNLILDTALEDERRLQPQRNYLGGSRLGHPLAEKPYNRGCARALYYEYHHTPKDPGKEFPGKLYRIFDQGHDGETRMIEYFKYAGFTLLTEMPSGAQFGFGVCPDPITQLPRIKGHADGVFVDGPAKLLSPAGDIIMLAYPFLWECKTMNDKKFNVFRDEGVENSHPVYYGQIQVYMGALKLDKYPTLFSALNKNTGELHFELIPYNQKHAQASISRGIEVISAQAATELPRAAADYEYLPCKWCEYKGTCKSDEQAHKKPQFNPEFWGGIKK